MIELTSFKMCLSLACSNSELISSMLVPFCWPNSSTTPKYCCEVTLFQLCLKALFRSVKWWKCMQQLLVSLPACLSYSISATIGSRQDSASTIVIEVHFMIASCIYSWLELHSIKFIKLQNFNVLNDSSDILIDIYWKQHEDSPTWEGDAEQANAKEAVSARQGEPLPKMGYQTQFKVSQVAIGLPIVDWYARHGPHFR